MPPRDLVQHLEQPEISITNLVHTTGGGLNGASVDTQFSESVAILACIGASADTLTVSVLFELQLEDSPDDSVWTDVVAADMIGGTKGANGQFALINDPAEDDKWFMIGYIGAKRYVRAVLVVTGTHNNGTEIGVGVMLGNSRRFPTAQAPST